jgi:RNA polymerase sigma factor (sigma-70 family)
MYMAMTQKEKNDLARQYAALIHKIAHQYEAVTGIMYEDLYGASAEGFARALSTYDGEGNLKQWLAYGCKNAVLDYINKSSRVITVPAYGRKKMEAGEMEAVSCCSLDRLAGDDDTPLSEMLPQIADTEAPGEGAVMEALKEALSVLTDKEREILCSRFGVLGYDVVSCTELAEKWGVSRVRISAILRKSYEKLRAWPGLRDIVAEWMSR